MSLQEHAQHSPTPVAFAPTRQGLQWLESIPGFVGLWRVGAPLEADAQAVEPDRFFLVATRKIRGPDRLRIEARLAAHMETRLLRLRTTTPGNMAHPPELCCREAWDLGLEAELIAGDDKPREKLSDLALGTPQPRAAQELFRSTLELALRCYPEPYMFRSAVLRGSPVGFPDFVDPQIETRRVFAEMVRSLGDAWLLLLGRYTTRRVNRSQRLSEHFQSRPLLRHLLDWAYSKRPLDVAMPESARATWQELRSLLLDGFATSTQQLKRKPCKHSELPDEIAAQRRGIFGRFSGRREAPSSLATRIDALLLQLILAIRPDGSADLELLNAAILRMRKAEGPTMAHPTWEKLRREALCLRRYAPDQVPLQVGSSSHLRAET
ncbi:MAG: hypothetical protein CSA62_11275 [Planctomycetota bacterium]|nr:MAG: hypothetical protein CSA62_11275 [Planctomycetota bacterium]